MDPEESPFSRLGRTLWAALAYISTSVVSFFRTETDTAGVDGPSSHEEDDATRETITQKCRSEHPEGGATEADMAVGSPITQKCRSEHPEGGATEAEMAVGSLITDVHSHLHTIPWEKSEVITDHHEDETNVCSVQYSKIRRRKTGLGSEKAKEESFEKRGDPKQDLDAEDVGRQIQDSSVSESHYREIMDVTVSHTVHINDDNNKADSLIKEVDDTLRTKLNSLDMGDVSAAGSFRIAEDGDPPGSGLAVHEVRGQEEKMMVQEVDHGNDPEAEAPQSRVILTEQDKAALCIALTEQRQAESYASHINQEEPGPDPTYNNQTTPQSPTTFIDQEEEMHKLTHRLVEAVVMSSVEFVNNELKTQRVHEEDHAPTSMTNTTSQDQVDSACDLMEQQQPILNIPMEAMTVWYDREAEEGSELAVNERHEGGQGEKRLGGETPEAHAHDKQPLENTERSEMEKEDETESQEAQEEMEDTEHKDCKAQDLEEETEQELFSITDQNRHEKEEQTQLQTTEDHISDKQPCEIEEDLVRTGVTVMESESEDDTTVETTDDKCPQEEVAENGFVEDCVDGQVEEHSSIEDAEVMPLDSPITAESAAVADMAQATSDMIKEDLLQVGQYSQEMSANAEEMIDGATEVTDTSQYAAIEELVGRKAEPLREERMEEGEKEEEENDTEEEEREEEEERDEFEGLRPTVESEDEGVSIDPDDTEVQEAQEGWHSGEGETDSTDGLTSPVTEANDALLHEAEIPESEMIETGTDVSLLKEDAELTTTEVDFSLTSIPKDTECDTQWESQMTSQETERATESGYTERDHTPAIFSTTCDNGAIADPEFVRHIPGLVLQYDAPEEMTLDHSDTEGELLENQQAEKSKAELKIKRQSNESKSLDESGCELDMKQLTTTILTDKSDQEESVDIMMGSELDMLKQSSKLVTSSLDPEAKIIEVAEEQVEELEKEPVAQQIDMEINRLRSESGCEDVAWTSQWDAFEKHENVDSSEGIESDKGASEEGRCETGTYSAEGIMLIETDVESNFLLSETADAVPEKSLHQIQVMTKGEETVEVGQIQADPDILSSDDQIHTNEAESGESQESEREYRKEIVEDVIKTQTQFCETGSMSSDDKESRETQEESKAVESNLMWEPSESESKMLEDEMGDECRSVVEIITDMNEETEFDRGEGESDGITETNPDSMEDGVQKALKEDIGEEHDEEDVHHMVAMQVESGETRPDGRLVLKRKLEDAVTEVKLLKGKQDVVGQLPAGGLTPQVSSLDFSIQKSRIAVKNPQVRPPKDPRTLLNLPSLEPTPRSAPELESIPGQPDKKPPAFGIPLGGVGVGVMGVKLPGLGAGFPVLRKTNREPKEEEKSESSASQEESETVKTQVEDTAEEVQTQSKPKWTPPKHAVGMGNPFMMAELKGKLKKPAKE